MSFRSFRVSRERALRAYHLSSSCPLPMLMRVLCGIMCCAFCVGVVRRRRGPPSLRRAWLRFARKKVRATAGLFQLARLGVVLLGRSQFSLCEARLRRCSKRLDSWVLVNIRGGTEAAVHAVGLAMQQMGPLGTDDGPLPSNACDPRVLEKAAGTCTDPLSLHYYIAIPTDVKNAFGELIVSRCSV